MTTLVFRARFLSVDNLLMLQNMKIDRLIEYWDVFRSLFEGEQLCGRWQCILYEITAIVIWLV